MKAPHFAQNREAKTSQDLRRRALRASVRAIRIEQLEGRMLLAAGDPDPSFGGDGFVPVEFPPADATANGEIAVQPDGKIVVLGHAANVVQRHNVDGSLDMSFQRFFVPEGYAMAAPLVQPDGKILLGGSSDDGMVVMRLTSTGLLDSSFSGDGIAVTSFVPGGGDGRIRDLALQGDGKIVAVGSSIISNSNGLHELVALRFNANGSLDTSFSGDGRVADTFLPGNDRGSSVAIQSNGRIVVAGTGSTGTMPDALLVRYNTNGTLDTSFAGKGWVSRDDGLSAYSNAMIQPDGKVLVLTHSSGVNGMDRYHSNGTRDTSFPGESITSDPTHDAWILDTALQPDGKILVAGSYKIEAPYNQGTIARYNADGTLDTSFGDNGVVRKGILDYDDVEVAPDGKIVIFADQWEIDHVMIRLLAEGEAPPDTQPPTTPGNFRVTGITSQSVALDWDPSTDNVGVQEYVVTVRDETGAVVRTFAHPPEDTDASGVGGLDPDTTYTISLVARDLAGNTSPAATLTVRTNPIEQEPFHGSPFTTGHPIEFEDFDLGAQGIAYNDTDATNNGGAYRNEGVDIKAATDAGGGHFVGWTNEGEWLEYTIDVPVGGAHNITTRLATHKSGGRYRYLVDGVDVAGAMAIPVTGSFFNFTSHTSPAFNLSPGRHVLRMELLDSAASTGIANFNWFRIDPVSAEPPEAIGFSEANGLNRSSIRIHLDAIVPDGQIARLERSQSQQGPWTAVTLLQAGESFHDDEGLAPGSYFYRVRSESSAGVSEWQTQRAHTAFFDSADIGNPGVAGGAFNPHTSTAWNVIGGGRDIHGNADQFQFAHAPVTGDFFYELQVVDLQPEEGFTTLNPWAKVGLMVRESLAAGSRNVAIVQSASNGPRFQVRSTTGGWTNTSGTGSKNIPTVLRLRRVGDTFIAYQGQSLGDPFVEIGRITLDLPDTIQFGIAVTSHDNSSAVTANTDLFGLQP